MYFYSLRRIHHRQLAYISIICLSCTMLDQRQRRWASVVKMLYKSFHLVVDSSGESIWAFRNLNLLSSSRLISMFIGFFNRVFFNFNPDRTSQKSCIPPGIYRLQNIICDEEKTLPLSVSARNIRCDFSSLHNNIIFYILRSQTCLYTKKWRFYLVKPKKHF